MAREEEDREDLLREATALVERVELRIPHEAETVVIGFRRIGGASFFFGADPVYQFNSHGQLRRAFARGLLYKADRGQLYEMRRERTASEVQLLSRQLTAEETAAFLDQAGEYLARLESALASGGFTLLGQAPENGDLPARLASWLGAVPAKIPVASSPRVGWRSRPWRGR